jgi:hypothetical protein
VVGCIASIKIWKRRRRFWWQAIIILDSMSFITCLYIDSTRLPLARAAPMHGKLRRRETRTRDPQTPMYGVWGYSYTLQGLLKPLEPSE